MNAAPEILGALKRHEERVDVRLEFTYPAGAETVWQAVTDPERLAGWFAAVEGELTEGGRYHVVFDVDNPEQQINGTIDECVAVRRLVLSWEMEGHPESTVALTLSDNSAETSFAETRLTLDHHGMREDTSAAYAAGWQAYLEALGTYLEGGAGVGARWESRWQELLPVYLHKVAGL